MIKTGIMGDTTALDSINAHRICSYSDCQGQLLVYGSHKILFNKNHQPLKNGIYGDGNTSNFYITPHLIPMPGNERFLYLLYNKYKNYDLDDSIFTYYLIVDLQGDNGLGEVIVKDQLLIKEWFYHIEYTKHANNRDIWIVLGNKDINKKLYLLTDSGFASKSPVISQFYSAIGMTYSSFSTLQTSNISKSICFTLDGKHLVTTGIDSTQTQLGCAFRYDFNNETGQFSNPKVLLEYTDIVIKNLDLKLFPNLYHNYNYLYCEVSPNDSLIYFFDGIDKWLNIMQVNRFTFQKTFVYKRVMTNPDRDYFIGYPNLAPNGKIYFLESYLSKSTFKQYFVIKEISFPNKFGTKCRIRNAFTSLGYAFEVLPRILDGYRSLNITSPLENNSCTDTAVFNLQIDTNFQNLTVFFGNGDSLFFNGPLQKNYHIKYAYPQSGDYLLTLKAQNPNCNSYSYFSDSFSISLIPKLKSHQTTYTPLCDKAILTINDSIANVQNAYLIWQNGFKTDTFKQLNSINFNKIIPRNDTLNHAKWSLQVGNKHCALKNMYADSSSLQFLKLPTQKYAIFQNEDSIITGCSPFKISLKNSSTNKDSIAVNWDPNLQASLGQFDSSSFVLNKLGQSVIPLMFKSEDNCTIKDSFVAIVYETPSVSISVTDSIQCFNSNQFSIKADVSTYVNYNWRIENAESYSENDSIISELKFKNDGHFKAIVTVQTPNMCYDSSEVTLTLKPEIKAIYNGLLNGQCFKGNAFEFNHSLDQFKGTCQYVYHLDENAIKENNSIKYLQSGNFEFKYIISDDFNCKDSVFVNHTVYDHSQSDLLTDNHCLNKTNQFELKSNQTVDVIKFITGDGQEFNTLSNYKYSAPGKYLASVIVKNTNQCLDTIVKSVVIAEKPIMNLATDSVCLGKDLNIKYLISNKNKDEIKLITLLWQNNLIPKNTLEGNYLLPYNGIGNYNITLSVEDTMGCKDSVIGISIVHPLPNNDFDYKRIGNNNIGIEFQFKSKSNNQKYNWNLDNYSSDLPHFNYTFKDSGKYNVTLTTTNEYGCEHELSKIVYALPKYEIYIPDAFTPNGDDINDVFTIYGKQQLIQWEMIIFNQWGEIIFNEKNSDWNGKNSNGEVVMNGVYSYYIKTKDIDNKIQIFKGNILLGK